VQSKTHTLGVPGEGDISNYGINVGNVVQLALTNNGAYVKISCAVQKATKFEEKYENLRKIYENYISKFSFD